MTSGGSTQYVVGRGVASSGRAIWYPDCRPKAVSVAGEITATRLEGPFTRRMFHTQTRADAAVAHDRLPSPDP